MFDYSQVHGFSVDRRYMLTKKFVADSMDITVKRVFLYLSTIISSALLVSGAAHVRAGFPDSIDESEFDCVMEPSEVVDIGSAVPGVIKSIYVNRSDPVKKGAIVAELESRVEQATVALSKVRAEATTLIRLRRESAEFGARTRERNQTLYRQSSISQEDLDRLETENRIAHLQVLKEQDNRNMAELEYERAQALLEKHIIRTPFGGVVVERFKNIGEYIEDKPVMRIAQLDPLNVEVILPLEFFGKLAVGRKAKIVPVLRDYEHRIATVTLVDKVVDTASGTFGARLTMPNPNNELPGGLRCTIAFLPSDAIPVFVETKLNLDPELEQNQAEQEQQGQTQLRVQEQAQVKEQAQEQAQNQKEQGQEQEQTDTSIPAEPKSGDGDLVPERTEEIASLIGPVAPDALDTDASDEQNP